MSEIFNKDNWIKLALQRGVIIARRDGVIARKSPTGEYNIVKLQTHKKSGRVYLNLKFMGITKSVLVNRIIGLAFIPNPENKLEVNHIDGVKAHNWVENLEWADRSEQELHAFATGLKSSRGSSNSNAKLTANDVVKIRGNSKKDIKLMASVFKVSEATIRNVLAGKTWKHL